MRKFQEKMARFMAGRYGVDELGKLCIYGSLLLLILSVFIRYRIIYLLALLALFLAYGRMFSRNIAGRYQENQKFLALKSRLIGRFTAAKRQSRDREHRYFTCPTCSQRVRVPKGKGRISIRCPRCSAEFVKRT